MHPAISGPLGCRTLGCVHLVLALKAPGTGPRGAVGDLMLPCEPLTSAAWPLCPQRVGPCRCLQGQLKVRVPGGRCLGGAYLNRWVSSSWQARTMQNKTQGRGLRRNLGCGRGGGKWLSRVSRYLRVACGGHSQCPSRSPSPPFLSLPSTALITPPLRKPSPSISSSLFSYLSPLLLPPQSKVKGLVPFGVTPPLSPQLP